MFGNRLGWGISAVIVMFAGFLAYLIYQAATVSPSTGWVPRTVVAITPPDGAAALVPDMTETRDAGEFYRRAIADFLANRSAYEALASAKELDRDAVANRPGLVALLDASHCATMNLFANRPQEVVSYDVERSPLEAVYGVGQAATRTALLTGVQDPTTAARYYEAIFSMGLKLYQERLVFDELVAGENLMGAAAGGLQGLAQRGKDTDRVRSIQQFNANRINDFQTKLQPVWAVVSSIEGDTIATYAGDMFVLAQDKHIDRLWRVEGTLKLGRIKYNAGRRGDQLAAKRVLREMSQDLSEDPAVRAAATAARDLTLVQYRGLR